MSSYQFVNTLAQCYAEQQQQQQQQQSGTQAGPQVPPQAPLPNNQDYYNMNYPSCYSPGLNSQGGGQYGGYGHLGGMMGAAGNNGDYSGRGSPSNNSSSNAVAAVTAVAQQLAAGKYSDSNVGSPQDLSTTSPPGGGGGEPKTPESHPTTSPLTSPSPTSPSASGGSAVKAKSNRGLGKQSATHLPMDEKGTSWSK
ncbi:Sex combs reduced [Caligus rogercresseyi]|uniref:Sex combs reduced n=1 Tax=Caligus rogercresseyi TaxID=217165 RepID=A0A7T8KBM1_CALRO|nr:Sex combs reduced [Caligus rogercresseyi]